MQLDLSVIVFSGVNHSTEPMQVDTQLCTINISSHKTKLATGNTFVFLILMM